MGNECLSHSVQAGLVADFGFHRRQAAVLRRHGPSSMLLRGPLNWAPRSEERFREATLWTFAEENFAADYPDVRNRYAKQAHEAGDDAQDELKRRVRVWRKTQEFLKDTT